MKIKKNKVQSQYVQKAKERELGKKIRKTTSKQTMKKQKQRIAIEDKIYKKREEAREIKSQT